VVSALGEDIFDGVIHPEEKVKVKVRTLISANNTHKPNPMTCPPTLLGLSASSTTFLWPTLNSVTYQVYRFSRKKVAILNYKSKE